MAQKTTTQQQTSQTANANSQTSPWDTQSNYLNDAFQRAQQQYGASNGNQYSGNLIAGLTPEQEQTYRAAINFSNAPNGAPQYSNAAAANATQTAANLNQTGAGYGQQAQGLYGLGGNAMTQGMGTTAQGVGALGSAYNSLAGYNPTGGTGTNISAAAQYADNPYISDMVQASMRDATRGATEQQLPGIARNAALSNNIGSSKRGIAEGIVTRGLNDQAGDVSAALRGDAYKSGLSLAENARQFNNSAVLDALKSSGTIGGALANAGLGQFGAGVSAANAGTSAGQLGLGFNSAANDATRTGLDANNSALLQQAGLFDMASGAGAGLQAGNQQALDNSRSQIEYQNQQPWDQLARYMSIVGGQSWGQNKTGTEITNGTQNGTQSTQPSPFAVAGGLLGAGTSLFGGNGFNLLQPAGKALSSKLFG